MKNKKGNVAVAICCLGSLVATNVGRAALTQIKVTAVSGLGGISSAAYNNDAVLIVDGIKASTTWSGSWDAKIVGGQTYSPDYDRHDTFIGFCTDIANQMPNSGNSGYKYEARGFNEGAYANPEVSGTPPDPNWANALSGQRAAWMYNTHYSLVNNDAKRSALAIAIWECLYEGSATLDVTSKNSSGRSFQATGNSLTTATDIGGLSVAELANSWLVVGQSVGFAGYNLTWWAEQQSTSYGDVQSIVGPGPMSAAVPEPTTMIAGVLLLLPFGASTIRFIRRNRTA